MPQNREAQSRQKTPSFAPRGFAARSAFSESADARAVEAAPRPSSRHFTNASAELTRNSNYVVSRLVALPNSLKNAANAEFNGTIDENTSHALLISDQSVSVWKYSSSDSIPTTIQLPVAPSNNGFPPIAHIVSPSAGSTDPGVVIVNSHTGHIRFYENIETASSIGLLQRHKGIDHMIKLADREFVTVSESIEPAGILLTTSTGRVILVALRDAAGNPFITTSEIVHRQSSFFSVSLTPARQIVAIKAGSVMGQGERIAAMVTRGGDFQVRSCARNGQSEVILQQNIFNALLEHIVLDEKYSGIDVAKKLEVIDLAPLSNFGFQDVFLLLTSIEVTSGETSYVTFIIRRDEDHLLLFSAYRVRTYTTPYKKKPQLYVPSPGSTAFIMFEDAIVLVQLPSELNHEKNNRLRKWEDIITFRSGLQIIGSGAENYKEVDNEILHLPSAYVLLPQVGVLRIERLQPKEHELYENPSSGVLKSHIEQAVFYGDESSGPLEFDLPVTFQIDAADLKHDLLEVANEIMNSKSPYLPPRLSSLGAHLQLRQNKLKRLLQYTASNVGDIIGIDTKVELVTIFEKVSAALHLHRVIDKLIVDGNLKPKIENVIQLFSASERDFFHGGLDKLTAFIVSLLRALGGIHSGELIAFEIITRSLSVVLEAEKTYRFGLFKLADSSCSSLEPWFTTDGLFFLIDEVFERYVTVMRSELPNANASQSCVELAEILFYSLHERMEWLKNKTPKTRADQDALDKDQAFYKSRSGVWTKDLVLFGAKVEALAIAETYQDLQSLVEISDEEREVAQGTELENVNLRFDYYFNKFGYRFAETLYNYYTHTGKFQVLISGFPQYGEFLKKFFTENDHGKISWARDVLDGEYNKAANVLLTVAQKNDTQQSNRHLQLSIAKLSALADDSQNNEVLQTIQEELDFVEAQISIFAQINQFIRSDSDPAAQTDSIVAELLQKQYKSTVIIKQSFQRSLNRLLSNRALSVNELIDVFTLLDSKITQTKLNYFYALKALHLSNQPENEKTVNEKLIWRRAFLSDDWVSIISAENKSDEWIREHTENTVLFETLLNYFSDSLYIVNNDYQISLPDLSVLSEVDNDQDILARFKFIGDDELQQLKREISSQASQLKALRSSGTYLDDWIKALIGTANEKSGANKVINYSQLTIQNV
jgi:nuclear pore complex protein Nup133